MAREQIEEIVLKISVDDSQANQKMGKFSDNSKKATKSTKGLSIGLKSLTGIFAALGIAKIASQALEVAKQFDKIEKSLNTVTTTTGQAAEEFAFMNREADRLGINLISVSDGYIKLLGATKGTALAGQVTRDLASGVFELSTAMGLAESETNGIIRAVSQIATKGKLSTEELMQLAERGVPAFQLASKAIGVTTSELNKLLEQGKIMSEDFLPKFADELRNNFAGAADEASQSLVANSNRLKNEWARSLKGAGHAVAKFTPLITTMLKEFNNFGVALDETIEGVRLWKDELFGLSDGFDQPLTDAEIKMKQAEQAALALARGTAEATKEAKKFAEEQKKIAKILGMRDSLLNIERGFVFAGLTDELGAELSLTESEIKKLGPAIRKSLEEGASFADVKEQVSRIIVDWKEELKGIKIDPIQIVNPFNEALKSATLLKKAVDLRGELGLNKKEFEKISGVLVKAIDDGISLESIKAKIRGLRDVGFFDEEVAKEKGTDFKVREAVQSTFQAGTAEASAFLQNTSVQLEQLDVLKELVKVTKNKNKNNVELIAK